MRRLWFKQHYVEPILTGAKRETIRRAPVAIVAGDVVAFSVGPREPFATARIVAVDDLALADLDAASADQVRELMPDAHDRPLVRIRFVVADDLTRQPGDSRQDRPGRQETRQERSTPVP